MMALKSCPKCHRQQAACSSPCKSVSSGLIIHRRSAQRLVVSCSAGSLTASELSSGGLAIYSWPKASKPVVQRPVTRSPTKYFTTQMWFEAMVQTVVKQLDGGAFLLRVSANPVLSMQLIRLDPAVLAAGWEHIQQRHLTSALQQDEAVILVHPVASADQPCVVRQAAGEPCAGCPHEASQASAAAAAAAAAYGGGVTSILSAPASAELLHGHFGECCEGEHGHGDHAHHHHQHSSSSSTGQQQQQPDTETAFYGLVVQTRDAADPLQGCYLLKTMKQSSSSSSECHCTHYSLNQICKGPSLRQQYQASWLV